MIRTTRRCGSSSTGCATSACCNGSAEEIISSGSYRRYYMHRTSHWLGMDVHDVGVYRQGAQSRALEPGMVLTVEPGIYIAPDDEEAPESFRGIGIRIEDDVLVTPEGHEVITPATPKKVADLEALTLGSEYYQTKPPQTSSSGVLSTARRTLSERARISKMQKQTHCDGKGSGSRRQQKCKNKPIKLK